MTDIVEELREDAEEYVKESVPFGVINYYEEERHRAADEIERLRKQSAERWGRLVELENALAGVLGCIGNCEVDRFQYAMIKQARTALEGK